VPLKNKCHVQIHSMLGVTRVHNKSNLGYDVDTKLRTQNFTNYFILFGQHE